MYKRNSGSKEVDEGSGTGMGTVKTGSRKSLNVSVGKDAGRTIGMQPSLKAPASKSRGDLAKKPAGKGGSRSIGAKAGFMGY